MTTRPPANPRTISKAPRARGRPQLTQGQQTVRVTVTLSEGALADFWARCTSQVPPVRTLAEGIRLAMEGRLAAPEA